MKLHEQAFDIIKKEQAFDIIKKNNVKCLPRGCYQCLLPSKQAKKIHFFFTIIIILIKHDILIKCGSIII